MTFLHTVLLCEKLDFSTALVVCPLNTVLNWLNEFTKWQEGLKDEESLEVAIRSCLMHGPFPVISRLPLEFQNASEAVHVVSAIQIILYVLKILTMIWKLLRGGGKCQNSSTMRLNEWGSDLLSSSVAFHPRQGHSDVRGLDAVSVRVSLMVETCDLCSRVSSRNLFNCKVPLHGDS